MAPESQASPKIEYCMNLSPYYLFFLRVRSLMVMGVKVHDRENRAMVELIDLEKVIKTQCTNSGCIDNNTRQD